MKLKQKIVEIHHHNRRAYGSPRIHQVLLKEGYHISKSEWQD